MSHDLRIVAFVSLILFTGASTSTTFGRTWTARDGRQVEADFVSFNDGKVTVKRQSDGKLYLVPLEELSDGDQEFVKSHRGPERAEVQYTIRTPQGDRSSREREAVLKSLTMTADEVRAWVEDPKFAEEGRSATLNQDGHVEIIWRGPAGQLLYSVRTEQGSRTSPDRGSVLKTRKMTSDQLKAWGQAPEGKAEGRVVEPDDKVVVKRTVTSERGSVFSREGASLFTALDLTDERSGNGPRTRRQLRKTGGPFSSGPGTSRSFGAGRRVSCCTRCGPSRAAGRAGTTTAS